MGNFYTNYTLKGPTQQAVAAALAGRTAIVAPSRKGCVVAFDEESDEQDVQAMAKCAEGLSRQLRCPLLAVLNHDDDILWYQLYAGGGLLDEYDSTPGYFDSSAEADCPDRRRCATPCIRVRVHRRRGGRARAEAIFVR